MAGRNYSRKESPALSDLPLIWDAANADWRLSTIQSIKDLVLADRPSAEAPLVELEAVFVAQNPVLELGQLGIALDQNYFKIGDGVLAWNSITPRYEADTYLGTAAARDHGTASDEVPLNSDLGTAAVADVQTSLTDTTAGRVILNGGHGLGSTELSTSTDLNTESVTGFKRWTNTTTNTPDAGQFGVVYTGAFSSAARMQMVWRTNTSDKAWMRRYASGTWSAWVELYHSGNYPSDTAWMTGTAINGWTSVSTGIKYIKRAGWVTISFRVGAGSKISDTLINMPPGYRPSEIVWSIARDQGGSAAIGSASARTDGDIIVQVTGNDIVGSITYPVIT